MKTLLAWAAYPVIVGGGMVAGGIAFTRGASIPVVIVGFGAASMIVVALLERVIPHVARWNRSHGDIVPDALHLVVSNAGVIHLVNVFLLAAVAAVAVRIESVVTLWPGGWPLVAQVGLALVVGELGIYWAHRMLHARALLWRVHELHHSAERMYWLNGFRNHPLDAPLQYISFQVPLVLIGAGPVVIGLMALYQALHTPLQHSNVAVKTGPLSYVLATAELHRWHHAPTARAASGNYGTNLMLWDLVFRTFRRPAEPCVDVGLAGAAPFPRRYLDQLLSPFKVRQTVSEPVGTPSNSTVDR